MRVMCRWTFWLGALLFWASGTWALAQAPADRAPPEPPTASPPASTAPAAAPPAARPFRDPTQVDPQMQRLLGIGPQTGAPAMSLPAMKIRGRAIDARGQALALLDVDGKMFVVRSGMRLSLPGGTTVLKVQQINAREVTFEIEGFDEQLHVR